MTEFCSMPSQTRLMQSLIYSSCVPECSPGVGTLLRGKSTFPPPNTLLTAQVKQLGLRAGTFFLQTASSVQERELFEIRAASDRSDVEMLTRSTPRQLPTSKLFQVWPAQWKTSISGKLA